MHDYKLTQAEIDSLKDQLQRDSAELDQIFDSDAAEKQMLAEAKAHVINSKSYASAKTLIDIAASSGYDIGLHLRDWEGDRLIFAFNHAGVDYFPLYAFDPEHEFNPYTAMAEILVIFGKEKSGWECAFWFEGINGFLSGKAPKDLIAVDPNLTIKAAVLEMQPVAHG